jgi:xanthine dehydrogenase small subunit
LIALNASVVLASADGERTINLADYYQDDGIAHTVRRTDEIVTRVVVPPPAGRMVYIKETARKGNDFAYATIAVWADGRGTECKRMRMVLGSLTMRPVMLHKTAKVLTTNGLTDAAILLAVDQVRDELGPLTNLYTPAAYKSRLARSLVGESLRQLGMK